jgi:cysteine desulfurase/selenocysteine lyase
VTKATATTTIQPHPEAASKPPFDVQRIRQDFPILAEQVNGHPLIYLDSAATTQKPLAVLNAIRDYYEHDNANVHRGVHALSVRATQAYERARSVVQAFIGAERVEEIVFCRGTTEAINLVAQTYGRSAVAKGDEIVVSEMEHHSNIVPWQILCEQTGAALRVIPINDSGELILEEYEKLLNPRTKLVAVGHMSNALGTINPVRQIADLAHSVGARVVVDGAQALPHLPVDVAALDCDFYAMSAHKVFGPTGAGALYARYELLSNMPPYQGGGEMIESVSFSGTRYNKVPHKFEAGTPNIAGVIGMSAALDYVSAIGHEPIAAYEQELLAHATGRLAEIDGLRLIGTAAQKAAVVSFTIDGVHPHDVGTILDLRGIAVRTGHHCAQPTMERFGIPATTRASLAFYNTRQEIDALADAVAEVGGMFR